MGIANRIILAVGGTLLAAIVILAGVYNRWVEGSGVTLYSFVFGSRGIVDILLGAATLTAGAVTIVYLARRAQHDDRVLRQSRFKDAIQMLVDERQAASIAGGEELVHLARDAPLRFVGPAATALTAFLTERTKPTWDVVSAYMNRSVGSTLQLPTVPTGSMAETQAFVSLGRVRKFREAGWSSGPVQRANRLPSYHYSLSQMRLPAGNYSDVDFYGLTLRDVYFNGCNFSNCTMHFFGAGEIRFVDCDLTNMTMIATDLQGRSAGMPQASCKIVFHGGTANGATLNGQPLIIQPKPERDSNAMPLPGTFETGP